MRCASNVTARALSIRSSDDPNPRCQRRGKERIGAFLFCYQHHHKLRGSHERVRARILAIPPRPVEGNPR